MMQSRRPHLLMVPYYFPPLGMGGVQRPLKFVRYLPEFGWDVTVLTAEPGSYHATDHSLLQELPPSIEVVRLGSFDPSRNLNWSDRSSKSHLSLLGNWLRFPDTKRAFVRPAVHMAAHLDPERNFDVIWTTSPPPSAHLVGLRLKQRLGIPWIADFRDPWFARFDDWGPTRWHARYSRSLRGRITGSADRVIAASNAIAKSLGDCPVPSSVIRNGFDEIDFAIAESPRTSDSPFTILLYGTFGENPDPEPLFGLLGQWAAQFSDRPLRIQHAGAVLGADLPALASRHGLGNRFDSLGYLPHNQSIRALLSADVIALALSARPEHKDILPGRVFEMLRSLRPILLLADPASETAELLRSIEGCWIVRQDDTRAGLLALNAIASLPRHVPARAVTALKQFDRREQTGQLATILDGLRSAHPRAVTQ